MQLQHSKINMVTSKGLPALVYSSMAQSRLNANHGPAWEPSRLKFLRTYLLKVMFLQPSCSLMIRQYSPLYCSCDSCYGTSQVYTTQPSVVYLCFGSLTSVTCSLTLSRLFRRYLKHKLTNLPSSFCLHKLGQK